MASVVHENRMFPAPSHAPGPRDHSPAAFSGGCPFSQILESSDPPEADETRIRAATDRPPAKPERGKDSGGPPKNASPSKAEATTAETRDAALRDRDAPNRAAANPTALPMPAPAAAPVAKPTDAAADIETQKPAKPQNDTQDAQTDATLALLTIPPAADKGGTTVAAAPAGQPVAVAIAAPVPIPGVPALPAIDASESTKEIIPPQLASAQPEATAPLSIFTNAPAARGKAEASAASAGAEKKIADPSVAAGLTAQDAESDDDAAKVSSNQTSDQRPSNTDSAPAAKAQQDAPQPVAGKDERRILTEKIEVPLNNGDDAASAGLPATKVATDGTNPAAASPSAPPAAAAAPPAPAVAAAPMAAAVPLNGVAVEIAARAQSGKNRFEIRLDPPELGRIDVRLHVDRDGTITSRLVVDRAETLDLLRSDAANLERALQQAGLKTSDNGLQFSLRDQSFGGRDQGGTPRNAARLLFTDQPGAAADLQPVYGRLLRIGGLDIRV